jgi:hypothetical protein
VLPTSSFFLKKSNGVSSVAYSARITEKKNAGKKSYATFSLRTVLQALQAI